LAKDFLQIDVPMPLNTPGTLFLEVRSFQGIKKIEFIVLSDVPRLTLGGFGRLKDTLDLVFS
jgi:hypothetical protein